VLTSIASKRYSTVGEHYYVFMGDGDVSKLNVEKNVIVCRNLSYNIEKHKNCLQFCGWKALYDNSMISTQFVRFLDYDVDIININDHMHTELKSYMGFDFSFYFTYGFGEADKFNKEISDMLGMTFLELLNIYKTKHPQTHWTSVGGILMTSSIFDKFMKWFEPIYENKKHDHYFSHHFERYLTIFLLVNDISYEVVHDEAVHKQLKSHNFY
jgi:hypothetical protein